MSRRKMQVRRVVDIERFHRVNQGARIRLTLDCGHQAERPARAVHPKSARCPECPREGGFPDRRSVVVTHVYIAEGPYVWGEEDSWLTDWLWIDKWYVDTWLLLPHAFRKAAKHDVSLYDRIDLFMHDAKRREKHLVIPEGWTLVKVDLPKSQFTPPDGVLTAMSLPRGGR